MIELLDSVGALSAWFFAMPKWLLMLIYGVLAGYTVAAGGFALARTGIKPLWVLLLLVPTVNLAALWLWACMRWPHERRSP